MHDLQFDKYFGYYKNELTMYDWFIHFCLWWIDANRIDVDIKNIREKRLIRDRVKVYNILQTNCNNYF